MCDTKFSIYLYSVRFGIRTCAGGYVSLGIVVKIGSLYDTQREFKSNKEPLYLTLSPVEHFLLFSLPNAFPEEWHKILRTNENFISSKTHNLTQTDFNLRIEGKKVNFQNLKSKSL